MKNLIENYPQGLSLSFLKRKIAISVSYGYIDWKWNKDRKEKGLIYTSTGYIAYKIDCMIMQDKIYNLILDSDNFFKDEWTGIYHAYSHNRSYEYAFDAKHNEYKTHADCVFCVSDGRNYIKSEIGFLEKPMIEYCGSYHYADTFIEFTDGVSTFQAPKQLANIWRDGTNRLELEPDLVFSVSFLQLLKQCDCIVAKKLLYASRHINKVKLKSPDYISFREKQGMIAYTPYGKELKRNSDNSWVLEGRQSAKPGKVAQMILEEKLLDKDLEEFSNCFKAIEKETEIHFEFVSFEAAYNYRNYPDCSIDSCMWNKNFTDFYPPKYCKVLVAVDGNGNYKGRALHWKAFKACDNEEIVFIDRIYGSDEIKKMFKNYAQKNNWHHKEFQSYASKDQFVNPSGDCCTINLYVPMTDQIEDDGCAPYMDTMTFGDNEKLYNYSKDIAPNKFIKFNNTCGEISFGDNYGQVQVADGRWYDEDQCFEFEGLYYNSNNHVLCSYHNIIIPREIAIFIDGAWIDRNAYLNNLRNELVGISFIDTSFITN